MGQRVMEISTEVFRLLQRRAPWMANWAEEEPGPTQKIVLPEEVYEDFIDRAVSRRQTLDEVVRDCCRRRRAVARLSGVRVNRCRRWMNEE